MKFLLILNESPYGNERSYNGLRLALALSQRDEVELKVFLIGDAVGCAAADQKTPDGFYNVARMIKGLVRKKVPIGVCGSCREARGLTDDRLAEGAHGSSMEELASWTQWAEKALIF